MRRLLEEVEREEGEHGTTFGLLFGVLRITKMTEQRRRKDKDNSRQQVPQR